MRLFLSMQKKINGAGYTDEISETPVTLNIEVDRGVPQTITYNAGGGNGSVPASATALSGSSYAMASGSGLTKDGNLFTSWTLSYIPFVETDPITRFVGGSESIVVPSTTNGSITATANYSGISAAKFTDSSSTVVTVTWDTNAPEGETAKFAGDIQGDFNSTRTKMFNKINRITLSALVPGAPTDLSSTMSYMFDGWYTDPVGGTKVTGSVNPTVNTTYYAHWLAGYKVTYDATGGTGATKTGKFSDGTTTTDEETVMPGSSTVGPSKGYPSPDDTSGDYIFYGWFNQPNGAGGEVEIGTSFDVLGGSKTVYAYYGLAYTFLAPVASTVTANPRSISGNKYSILEVKDAAQSIRGSGVNPNEDVYNATNDSYHLYSLLKGSDGEYLDASKTDSWAEFRIIGVGSHDSDGAGLTFQMVHEMPSSTGWAYDSTGKTGSSLNWANSTLRTLLQSDGSIYNQFDTQLTSRFMPVAKKYNTTAGSNSGVGTTTDEFSILSYTEYLESVDTAYWTIGQVGTTYAFWKQYSIQPDVPQDVEALKKLSYSRSDVMNKGTFSGSVWQRNVSPDLGSYVLTGNIVGLLTSYAGVEQTNLNGVALSFSL